MTAVAIAALALALLSTGGLIAQLVFNRQERKDYDACRDLLSQELKLSGQYADERDEFARKLAVADAQRTQEQNLRAVAEAQRNAAMERVRDLLRKHVTKATNEEIQELTNDAFTTPLAVAPRAPSVPPQVPRRSDSGADGLIDPFAEVQPPKPA